MKNIFILFAVCFSVLSLTPVMAERIPNEIGMDWRTEGPVGENWIKITPIHFLNNKSIKKVKGNI